MWFRKRLAILPPLRRPFTSSAAGIFKVTPPAHSTPAWIIGAREGMLLPAFMPALWLLTMQVSMLDYGTNAARVFYVVICCVS